MKADLKKINCVVIQDQTGTITDRINISEIILKETKHQGSVLFITEKE